jgi:hypothetical protein
MMSNKEEKVFITLYVTLYILGLISYYLQIPIIPYIFLGLSGMMMYRHIKIFIYMLKRKK